MSIKTCLQVKPAGKNWRCLKPISLVWGGNWPPVYSLECDGLAAVARSEDELKTALRALTYEANLGGGLVEVPQ